MKSNPLVVDLDGTLVNTDTLAESIVAAMQNWSVLIRLPLWLLRGKAKHKAKMAEHGVDTTLDMTEPR